MNINTILLVLFFLLTVFVVQRIFILVLAKRVSRLDNADAVPLECDERRIIVQKEKGYVASRAGFKKGQLREPNYVERLTKHTVMLTGTITALWEYCKVHCKNKRQVRKRGS